VDMVEPTRNRKIEKRLARVKHECGEQCSH